jgi:hypothetical protein
MRLLDAEDLAGFGLGEAARLDQLVDLQRQTRLQQLLLGMGQARYAPECAGVSPSRAHSGHNPDLTGKVVSPNC